jgi:hypothetical protein
LLAGRDIRIGLGYRDVREVAEEVAMEVFRMNFEKLSRNAHAVAHDRAEEFIHNFIVATHERAPEALGYLDDPGNQAAVLDAQSSYARSGDSDLGAVLIELLIQRVSNGQRDIAQLATTRALDVVKNVSVKHFSLLTCNFILKQVAFGEVKSVDSLASTLAEALKPFEDDLYGVGAQDLDYLTGLGCLISTAGSMTPGRYSGLNYPGLFNRGFTSTDMPDAQKLIGTPLVRQLEGAEGRYVIDAITELELKSLVEAYNLPDLSALAAATLRRNLLQHHEIDNLLVESDPRLKVAFERCAKIGMSSYINTAIGTAIAHSNLMRVNPDFNLPFEHLVSAPPAF